VSWSDDAIWWHAYPLGFLGAERAALPASAAPVPRLDRLQPWLDYLVELGCNGLALGPVFASETHGYDTVDHRRVDSRLGTEADLLRLVERARARGVHVLLDGVFNHVGRGFPAFADVVERGAASPYAGWFRRGPDGFVTFEGHERLVALNHAEPEVAAYVTGVMTHWLERGISGWRLDAAYAVPPAFWRTVTEPVRRRFPDAWLVGEVIHGDYAARVGESGLDSVTQYELWKAIWSSLVDRNLFELAWALDRHNRFLGAFAPLTFVGNHDVTRIATRLDDRRLLELAVVVLLTVGGVPSIYAGDEQAFEGLKEEREGGDDAVRPAFPDRPGDLAPGGWPIYRHHQLLVGLRRRHRWLVRARTAVSTLTNTAIVYTAGDGRRSLAVALNAADEPADLPLPAGDGWRVAAGGGHVAGGRVRLPGRGWAVLDPVAPAV
jgi:cyclomaltodextrinase